VLRIVLLARRRRLGAPDVEDPGGRVRAGDTWREVRKDAAMAEPSPVHELRLAVRVDSFERAVAFYRDALGLPVIRSWEDARGSGILLDAGHAVLELLAGDQAEYVDEVETGSRHGGATMRVALEVDDAPAVADRLVAAGGQRLGGPVDTPWGHRNVRLWAPEGVQLTLFTVFEPPADPPAEPAAADR
jgi:methylmalonyl-CoA/ethylmalonyl-CoA epimerase